MTCNCEATGQSIRAEILHQLDGGTYQTGVPQRALLAVLDRLDCEINAGFSPENVGKPPVPASMLRVYIHQDIARILGVRDD